MPALPTLPAAILFDLDDTIIQAYAKPEEAWTRLLSRFRDRFEETADPVSMATVLRVILAADGLRQPERFDELLLACEADARGRKGLEDRAYPQAALLRRALRAARSVDAAKVKAERNLDGAALGQALHAERLAAIKVELKEAAPVGQEQ